MKTITIRLPDVEAAMLMEVKKRSKLFKELDIFVAQAIRKEYQSLSKEKGRQ